VIPSMAQEEGGPSRQSDVYETETTGVQCLSPMREALGDILLLPGEYYLHQRWKGSRFLHWTTGKFYLHWG